jgi:hypothetical protein
MNVWRRLLPLSSSPSYTWMVAAAAFIVEKYGSIGGKDPLEFAAAAEAAAEAACGHPSVRGGLRRRLGIEKKKTG